MPRLLRILRPARPAAIGCCAVCRRGVTPADGAMRLHGVLVHRDCATYRVRHLARQGVRPGRLPATR